MYMYREQNNINWAKNEEFCIGAVRKYRAKGAKNDNVDDRVLTDWEHECISRRILRRNVLGYDSNRYE